MVVAAMIGQRNGGAQFVAAPTVPNPDATGAEMDDLTHLEDPAGEIRSLVEWAVDIYVQYGLMEGDGTPEGYIHRVALDFALEVDADNYRRFPGRSKPTLKAPINSLLRGRVLERDGDTCQHCGATSNLTIDHIVPVVRGGKATLENLQVLCRPCNSSKGAR